MRLLRSAIRSDRVPSSHAASCKAHFRSDDHHHPKQSQWCESNKFNCKQQRCDYCGQQSDLIASPQATLRHAKLTFALTIIITQSKASGAKATSSTVSSNDATIAVSKNTRTSEQESPIRHKIPITKEAAKSPNQLPLAIASSKMLVVIPQPQSCGEEPNIADVK